MHYLIDGHNLIGKFPDMSLEDPDDEVKLILRLRSWAARKRGRRVTVIFDHGLPGGMDKRLSTADVQVLFASAGQTADRLLVRRIQEARNPRAITVVSSDNHILQAARGRRMPALKAEMFVAKVSEERPAANANVNAPAAVEQEMSDAELAMWLDIFGAQDE